VLSASTAGTCRRQLDIFARYADRDGGVLEGVIPFKPEEQSHVQTTLVILKPENFMKPSARPGNIIDTFSRTGLYIVGTKILRMSVAQAREFYGPLRSMFVDKLRFLVEKRIVQSLLPALGFAVTGDQVARMADIVKEDNAESEFNKIIEFMTGRHPREVKSPEDAAAPGPSKCLALLYRGVGAIEKIREALGSTDPNKAESGTVRSDYGADLMRNGAHASDSAQNAVRERKIIGLAGGEPAQIVPIIREYLGA
jgi:nucleoside diphosphate kinase